VSDAADDRSLARAEQLAAEATAGDPDPVTRREAVEQELSEEGLSEEGTRIGQHID
jgi:hypothetical protein